MLNFSLYPLGVSGITQTSYFTGILDGTNYFTDTLSSPWLLSGFWDSKHPVIFYG